VADEKFKLPGTSYGELIKIITAYATLKKEASPSDVGQAAGKPREEVSRNNGFLVAFGVVEGPSRARRATREGVQLGHAIELQQEEEVARIWRSLAEKSEFAHKVLSAVRVRRGMERSALISHVAYTAGQKRSPQTMAGANCVVDILLLAGLLVEDDGKITAGRRVPAPSPEQELEAASDETEPALSWTGQVGGFPVTVRNVGASSGVPLEIRLNVSVECSVEELPSLAAKIRQLVQDLASPAADEAAPE